MRKLIFASLAFPFLIACNQEVKEQNARLQAENEELMQENQQKDSLINDFVTDFARIQDNLASIRAMEEEIETAREGGVETSVDKREEIIHNIESINELLSENRQTIANLQDKLKRYKYENSKFKRMVANLENQVHAKDSQVVVLKENLAAMNFEIEALNNKYTESEQIREQQKQRIENQVEEMNTAYYAVGTFDDLEENKVIDKKGGFIGIGKTSTLANDFNRDYFTKIDLTQTQSIPLEDIEEDDVRLVSNHPSDSYKWKKEGEIVKALEITSPEKFWGPSKYLVVLVD